MSSNNGEQDRMFIRDHINDERERCARLVMALGGPHKDFIATCIRDGIAPDKIEARIARIAIERQAEADIEDLM